MALRSTFWLFVIVIACAMSRPSHASAQEIREILELLDGGQERLYLRLRNGEWSYTSPRVPTAAWRFTGQITIRAPEGGKWRVQMIDLVRPPERGYPPVLDEIIEANQPVPFAYRTGGTAQLLARVSWSRRIDAIAHIEIEWDGCLCVLGGPEPGQRRTTTESNAPGRALGTR